MAATNTEVRITNPNSQNLLNVTCFLCHFLHYRLACVFYTMDISKNVYIYRTTPLLVTSVDNCVFIEVAIFVANFIL